LTDYVLKKCDCGNPLLEIIILDHAKQEVVVRCQLCKTRYTLPMPEVVLRVED